ncbi:MAG: diguanylate cyclase [Deltaproteobacteria bacterium]|nr:diguanylate cyclase [Deltaproteobacteria bacterium]
MGDGKKKMEIEAVAIEMVKTTKIKAVNKKKDNGRSGLSSTEIEILKWMQQGKTNDEIAVIIGKSKWTAKYYVKSILKKLDATTRAHAVGAAIGKGLLAPPVEDAETDDAFKGKRLSVGLVGGGRGGRAMIELFKENPMLDVAWAVDKNLRAPGIALAEKYSIPVAETINAFIKKKVDVVINLTGSAEIAEELRRVVPTDTELMGGVAAKIMWQMFEERRKRVEERERVLKEHETLYHLGLVIESIDSLKDAGYAMVDYATKLTNMPAGSLALFDEKKEDMMLVASKGFSPKFNKSDRWDIRKGGLTSQILNHNGPLFIEDIRESKQPNPLLMKEGVRSLLAAPITVDGRIVGILYVNDFKRRTPRAEDVSLFSLLTVYAGLTLDRVKSIEETRLLSITDGLTSLHNQRYMMEQLQHELDRATRHGHSVSVMLFDIDHFKQYNDTYGHLDGNKVLKFVARILKKCSRGTDTVCRFGGEEFCIVMPHVKAAGAAIFGKRLIKEVAKYSMPNRKVTMSGGLATFPEDGKTHTALLKKADSRLYKAKNGGRNNICCGDAE